MNIKAILLGSAAALVAISGARAADAIVAAEPEAVEYVRVCDAFGTGYFYIPGTETCLKISGYVRTQVEFDNVDRDVLADSDSIGHYSRGYVVFTAKNETELGTLSSVIALQSNLGDASSPTATFADEAFLSLGGFKMGAFYHWNDRGLAGEQDTAYFANTRFNSIMYSGNAGSFNYGISIDQDNDDWNTSTSGNEFGVSGLLGATVGGVSADVVGYYDTNMQNWGVRALASADLGMGSLGLQAAYNDGATFYSGGVTFDNLTGLYAEYMVGGAFSFAATDKLSLATGVQYASFNNSSDVTVGDAWKFGVTADYAVTTGLAMKATVNYEMFDGDGAFAASGQDKLSGFLRLQRNF